MKKLAKILGVFLLTALLFTSCNKTSNPPSVKILNPEVISPSLELPQASGKTFWKHFDVPLYGGFITAFAFDPNDANRILVALKNGEIYETKDSGTTWKKVGKIEFNLPCNSPLEIGTISISPEDSKVIFLGTSYGIFKSENNCTSWIHLSNGLSEGSYINNIYIDKNNPNILLANGGDGFYKSEDSGQTWYTLKTDFYPSRIVFDPIDSNTIYAADYKQIYKSNDLGLHWEKLGQDFENIIGFAIAPSKPNVIYVNSSRNIFVSKDSGKSFKKVPRKEEGYINIGALIVSPLNADTIISYPVYWRTAKDTYLSESFDGGLSWKKVFLGEGVRDLIFSPKNPKEFYLLTYNGNLVKSVDFGQTFISFNIFPEVSVEKMQIEKGIMYVLTSSGVFKSSNSHKTWTLLGKDCFDKIYTFSISPLNPGVVYASSNVRLYKLEDKESAFKNMGDYEFIRQIFINPNDINNIILECGDEGGYWNLISKDGGKTFTTARENVKLNLTVDPNNPKTIYAMALYSIPDGGMSFKLVKSEDGGKSFKDIGKDLEIMPMPEYPFSQIACEDSSTVYVGISAYGVYKSGDGGETFKPINNGLIYKGVKDLKFNPKTKDLFMLTYSDGVFLLKDGSTSWVDISNGLPSKELIKTIEVDSETGEVFIGTSGFGIYKFEP